MEYNEWFRLANRAIISEMAIQKVTQKELAQAVGVDPATINRKLKDPGKFTTVEFGKVCDRLSINMKNLSHAESAN
jgi:DNA-binding Xre family transcriptional regulator